MTVEGRLYEFVFRGLLAEAGLDKAGRRPIGGTRGIRPGHGAEAWVGSTGR